MKICIACSSGGHLTEILQLKEVYEKREHFFLTFERANTHELAKRKKVYFVTDPKRNPLLFLITLFQSLNIFLNEKPDVILSTGAGVAVPICYIAKFFGKKIIFFESFCKTQKPGFASKIIYPIADLFFVQWPEMQKYYPKAKLGSVF